MSVKPTETFLTFFETGNYLPFLKELVYTGVKFEVLNPDELSTKWAVVHFKKPSIKEVSYLEKLDFILDKYQPKGLFASLIDSRPETKLSEIQKLESSQNKHELFEITDLLFQYSTNQELLKKAKEVVLENPEKAYIFGKNLQLYKEQLDSFGLKVIADFRKNHDDQDIDESIPEVDFLSLKTRDALFFEKDNLDYVFDFKKSALGNFEVEKSTEFITNLENKIAEIKLQLKAKEYNPEKLSSRKYKELCTLYSDLELETILGHSERFVFSISEEEENKIQPSYAFISVSQESKENYKKIVRKNNLVAEPADWDKEIVVWDQSENLNAFKGVAQSLGTISTKETDPSLIISIFFSLFFAFCLGDAVYGLILASFCGYFLFFKNLKSQFENIFRLFFISGLATIVFGALLNSWAGDLFVKSPASGLLQSLQLINPLDPLAKVPVNQYLLGVGLSPIVAMLGLSAVIGLVNIMVGYTLKTINEFKAGNMANFFEELNWVAFLLSLVAWILSLGFAKSLSAVFLGVLAVTGLGFFVLNGGKGIGGKIISGLGKFYGLISFGADILSFTRLVAVGLTGGIIASVINLLAFLIYDSIPIVGLDILACAVVLLIGHAFNLVISLFGAYINPLRLHYVEFLPKFYDAKGRKLATLKTEFKYLKLVN